MALNFSQLSRDVQGLIRSKEFLKFVGDEIVFQIRTRTRDGRGVDNSNSPSPQERRLRDVQPRYAEFRNRVTNRSEFTPSRGNSSRLTLTGQMLNALRSRNNGTRVEAYIENSSRRPVSYISKRDGLVKNQQSRITNKQLADFVSDTRPFMALTVDQLNILSVKINDFIKVRLEALLNKLAKD